MGLRLLLALSILVSAALPAALAQDQKPIYPAIRGEYHTYVLDQPLLTETSLSNTWRGIHYGGHLAWAVAEYGAIFHHTGAVGLAVTSPKLVSDVFKVVGAELPAASYAQLKFIEGQKIDQKLEELNDTPGIDRAEVLCAGPLDYERRLAVHRDGRGLVVIQSREPLGQLPPGWGKPIEVPNTSYVQLKLSLQINGQPSTAVWSPTLLDASSGEPIPTKIAEQWREEIEDAARAAKKEKVKTHGRIKSLLKPLPQSLAQLQLTAEVEGTTIALGTIQDLAGTESMLHMTLTSKAVSAMMRVLDPEYSTRSNLTTLDLNKPPKPELPPRIPRSERSNITRLNLFGPPAPPPPNREERLDSFSKDFGAQSRFQCHYHGLLHAIAGSMEPSSSEPLSILPKPDR